MKLNKKRILKSFLVFCTLLIVLLVFFYFRFSPASNPEWGLNFSSRHATYLGFDWKKVYNAVLVEMQPKYIRLPVYWEDVEAQRGEFTFGDLDYQLREAEQYGIKVILVLGKKQPRWPECHFPEWYKGLQKDEGRTALFNYMKVSGEHFKTFSAVELWQVENEPIFGFGPDCPKISTTELAEEVAFMRGIDPSRPIIVTDSGELGRWVPTALSGADYFGSTMYRVVHNPKYGYFSYHLPPAFFRIKAGILNTFARPKAIYGVELQAEPWFATDVLQTPIDKQYPLMNATIFKDNTKYAEAAGFERNYLWGTEWWYWMKEKNNDPSVWNAAVELFRSNQ